MSKLKFFSALFVFCGCFVLKGQDAYPLDTIVIQGKTIILSVQMSTCNGDLTVGPSTFSISTNSKWPEMGVLKWKIKYESCNNEVYEMEFYRDISRIKNNGGGNEISDSDGEQLRFEGAKILDKVMLQEVNTKVLPIGKLSIVTPKKLISETTIPSEIQFEIPEFALYKSDIQVNIINGYLSRDDSYDWFFSKNTSNCDGPAIRNSRDRDVKLNVLYSDKNYLCLRIANKPELACNCKPLLVFTELPYRLSEGNSIKSIYSDINYFLGESVSRYDNGNVNGEVQFFTKKNGLKKFVVKQNKADLVIKQLELYLNNRADLYNSAYFSYNSTEKPVIVDSRDSFPISLSWSKKSTVYDFPSKFDFHNAEYDDIILNCSLRYKRGRYFFEEKMVVYNGVSRSFKHVEYQEMGRNSDVYKSLILPGWGSRQFANNKYTRCVSKCFIISGGVSIFSHFLSDKWYNNYLNAQTQKEADHFYNAANFSNRVYVCSGLFALATYSFDLTYTYMLFRKNNSQKRRVVLDEPIQF